MIIIIRIIKESNSRENEKRCTGGGERERERERERVRERAQWGDPRLD